MSFRPLILACALVIGTAVTLTVDHFDTTTTTHAGVQSHHETGIEPLTIQTSRGSFTLTVI